MREENNTDDENNSEGDLYDEEEEHYPHDDEINPHAELTDGFDSQDDLNPEADNKKNIDFSKINFTKSDEDRINPVNSQLAETLIKSWQSEKSLESMKKLYEKYKCPENCLIMPPKVNPELWKLLNSWQRKSDVKFSTIQKSLKKVLNASISVLQECQKETVDFQQIAQITTDMAALLGHSSHELSLKRRVFIRSVINTEFKDLCSTSHPVTENLFGDDLPKVGKELKLTNTLGNKFSRKNYNNGNKNYDRKFNRYRPYNNTRKNSFLGQGRGTSHNVNGKRTQEARDSRKIKYGK